MSLKFLLLLYDIMGGSGKHTITLSFIFSKFQYDLSIVLIYETVGLNAVVRLIGLLIILVLYINISFRDFLLAFSNWFAIRLVL